LPRLQGLDASSRGSPSFDGCPGCVQFPSPITHTARALPRRSCRLFSHTANPKCATTLNLAGQHQRSPSAGQMKRSSPPKGSKDLPAYGKRATAGTTQGNNCARCGGTLQTQTLPTDSPPICIGSSLDTGPFEPDLDTKKEKMTWRPVWVSYGAMKSFAR